MFKDKICSKIYGERQDNEAIAKVAVKPGYLVEYVVDSSVNKVQPHATAKAAGEVFVAVEDSMVGKTVTDEYAIGARVKFVEGRAGDEFNMVLKASENVAVNDLLESAGTGKLQKAGAAAAASSTALFRALEASNVTTDALILVKVINPVFAPATGASA